MKRLSKPTRDTTNNEYLNFIKKNHLRLLADQEKRGHYRSLSKGQELHTQSLEPKKTMASVPIAQGKTLTIELDDQQQTEEVFPTGFNGSNFGSYRSQKKRVTDVQLSNADIECIIEDKRQSIMKIVYESVQISIGNNKRVLLKPEKTMLKGEKKSIVKLLNYEKEMNENKDSRGYRQRESRDTKQSSLKLPDIGQQKDPTTYLPRLMPTNEGSSKGTREEHPSAICYNDYIRNNYLDVDMQMSIDRKLSQELPMAVRRRRISQPNSQRYEQNEKLVQTFYEYERLMQLKELRIQQKRIQLNRESSERTRKQEKQQAKPSQIVEERIEGQNDKLSESEQELLRINDEDSPKTRERHSPLLNQQTVKELTMEEATSDNDIPASDNINQKKMGKSLPKAKNYSQKDKEMTVYEHKISTYRDFLFKVNFAHGRFDALVLKEDLNYYKQDFKYKAYIGRGNNSLLIRSLLKRRYWWTFDQDIKNCHFIWTQLKINSCFDREKPCQLNYCLDDDQQTRQADSPLLPKKKKKNSPAAANQQSRSKLKPDLPKGSDKIMNSRDRNIMEAFEKLQLDRDRLEDMEYRTKFLEKKLLAAGNPSTYVVHNHLECNYYIGNKKAMFYNLRQYYGLVGKDVFDYLPLTFHIKKGLDDKDYKNFVKYFRKREQLVKAYQAEEEDGKRSRSKAKKQHRPRNIWIVKPGEISNRGNGITVIDELYELNKILKSKQKHPNGNDKTYIVQAYLDRPLLYHRRKFDLRHYMLITTLYGRMKAYWYAQGYIRTSSCEFDLSDLGDPMIHLTNDAIQKYGSNYGRYEEGNKLSYAEFQRYLDQTFPQKKLSFYDSIYPKMREVARDAVRSSYLRLDPRCLQHNFEVFGLDFMIDQDFNPWLIEINTNPCLEISSGLLGRIIPNMVEHAFRLSLDVLFPPMAHYPNTQKHLAPDNALDNLRFELLFDQEVDGKQLRELYKSVEGLDCGEIDQEEQTYENEGKEYDQDVI